MQRRAEQSRAGRADGMRRRVEAGQEGRRAVGQTRHSAVMGQRENTGTAAGDGWVRAGWALRSTSDDGLNVLSEQ